MASTVILTSAPLLLSQVPLASFVPDVSQPYADVKKVYTVSQSEYSVRRDIDFTGVVSVSSERFLEILATRFANLLVRREQGSTYRVEAKSGRVYTLDSPHDLFTAILENEQSGEKAKRWLEQCKQQGLSPRFVVGYRTFIDTRLSRGEKISNEVRGDVTLPLSTLHGDMSGMADIKTGVGHKAGHEVQSEAGLPDERIYAIAYRKISIKSRKGDIAATLDLKTKWEPFSALRSQDGPGTMYLEVDVSGTNDVEECKEIIVVKPESGGDGQALRLAVLDEDGSEEDEAL